jgi:methionine-rich copper-binding protein CopC
MTRSRLIAAPVALLLALAVPTAAAFAHAHLKTAVPAPGGTVGAAPTELVINYSEAVEPHFCTVAVTGPDGKRVDTGAVHTAPGNAHELVVPLKPLSPGRYTVDWHATSVDSHKTQGDYTFTVTR